jgi:hypothetical protein
MEHQQQRNGAALNETGIPTNQWKSKDCPLEECRTLVRALVKKTEKLYRNCRYDQEKSKQILAIGSILITLTVVVNSLDNEESGNIHAPDILTDAEGFTYQTVRFCDLDRIRDK